ncbi:signal peptidase I [Halomicrococcus gelatinilyticus]|uniref:signal peptidase I n=1 Tax=Halomicrococcus gelatinilyticus TaxID=1702103 RepID=UPI002E0D9A2B
MSGSPSTLRQFVATVPAKRLVHLGGLALLCAGVVVSVAVAAPQVVGANHSYVVMSGSMSPTIEAGDVVFVRDAAPASIEEGDVITFRSGTDSNSVLTTHRVVAVDHSGGQPAFQTKGDANEDPDPRPIPADDVVGRVWFHLPYVGHLVLFAQSRLGVITLVVVPSVLLVVTEAYELARAAFGDSDAGATSGEGEG